MYCNQQKKGTVVIYHTEMSRIHKKIIFLMNPTNKNLEDDLVDGMR